MPALTLHSTDLDQVLPHLLPQIVSGLENPAIATWSQLALTNPVLYQVWVYCAVVLYNAMRSSGREQQDLLISTHSKAISLLNEEMKDSKQACSDENMLSVLALACHGRVRQVSEGHERPNQGPLREIQGLAHYALVDLVPLHIDGLASLVNMRGGLGSVGLVGLGAAISQ